MNLIKDLEIGYFRSIYKFQLSKITDMNIFFGRNDSGKSNVLRALNLFFNDETNPGVKFDFGTDFCHARLEETKETDSRKFVYIKITFKTPNSWIPSLGKSFFVKKTWSIQRKAEASFESSVRAKNKQIYLTRFLNSIRYIYIPAIKDRTIFSELFSSVYKVLAKDVKFNESLIGFQSEIEKNTRDISEQIFKSLLLKSSIAAPSDLTVLFRSLDFDTINSPGDKYSLTLQHGDGIQVRHIPALLSFISDKDDYNFNLWGFEEPENSLELASAFSEAATFYNYSKTNNKQIFITSHSPAFFSLNEKGVSRIFIYQDKQTENGRMVSKEKNITESEMPSELMGETPYLPVISSYLKEYDEKLRREKIKTSEIEIELKKLTKPVLFVEGEADKIIIDGLCIRIFAGNVPFEVKAGDGTMKMESLSKDGKTLMLISHDKKIFILVDNDGAGRDLYSNSHLDNGGKWIIHNSNKTNWCRLPFSAEFISEYNKVGIQKTSWPGVMENCFSKRFRLNAIRDGAMKISNICYEDILKDSASVKKIAHLFNTSDFDRMYFFPPEGDCKIDFASYVIENTKTDESEITWLINILKEIGKKVEV